MAKRRYFVDYFASKEDGVFLLPNETKEALEKIGGLKILGPLKNPHRALVIVEAPEEKADDIKAVKGVAGIFADFPMSPLEEE